MFRDEAFLEAHGGFVDPIVVAEAADAVAATLVRHARSSEDAAVVQRVVALADDEGIEALAELWSTRPAESIAGSLWRLYLVRQWVYADPVSAARQFDAGREHAEVAQVVAGVADPPGPDAVRVMIDEVLRGIATGEYADVLLRAAAFTRVVGVGRAALGVPTASLMVEMSSGFEAAARLEMGGHLH